MVQDQPVEGGGELTGNLSDQIRDPGVVGQERGYQQDDPIPNLDFGLCAGKLRLRF
jgi:hypothetical protein